MNTMLDLGRMKEVPIDMTLESLAALNRTKQNDELGLQELMRQQQFNRQADPMRLQQMQTTNDQGLQTLAQLKRTNKEADFVSDEKMQADLIGHLSRAKQGDVDMAVARLQEMAMSEDLNLAARGRKLLAGTKEFLLRQQDNDAAMARQRQQSATQLEVARIGAGSREKVAALAAQARKEQAALKTPKDWQEYAVRQQMLLTQEADPAVRAALEQNLIYAQGQAERLRPPQQTLNPEMTGGMYQDPRGPVPAPPGNKPAAAQHSLAQLRGMYPGRSDAELKTLYKNKFGVEPQ